MTIKFISTLAFLVPFLYSVDMKHDPIGKTYKALIGETCKEMTDGGCMIYTYRVLNFKTDSVVVSYRVIANCSPKERENNYNHMNDNLIETYKWSISSDTITINGLEDYGKLTLQNSKLVGEGNLTKRYIEFNEEQK